METTQALSELQVPLSVQRVLRFVEDYSLWLDAPDETRSLPIGNVGLQAIRFAEAVSRPDASSLMLQSLKVRHGVFSLEIREFALWLRQTVTPAAEWPVADLQFPEAPDLSLATLSTRRRRSKPSRPIQQGLIEIEEEFDATAPQARVTIRRKLKAVPTETLFELVEERSDARSAVLKTSRRPLWPAALGAGSLAFSGMIADGMFAHSRAGGFSGHLGPRLGGDQMLYPPPIVTSDMPVRIYGHEATRAAIGRGLAHHQAAGFPRVPSRDLMAGVPGRLDPATSPVVRQPASLPFSPLLGQVTLVAPPVRVADPKLAGKGAAIAFDLPSLRKGATHLTPDSLQALKEVLPPGTQALYPALPLDSLGPSAVNLPLAPETIDLLMEKGYGREQPGWADSIANLAWSTPAATTLTGSVVPNARPVAGQAGLAPALPGLATVKGAVDDQRRPSATRGGILDFLGMPFRLAPSPEQPHELKHRQVARLDMRSAPSTPIRPNVFAGLQRGLFPHFQTVTAVPHAPSWKGVPASQSGLGAHISAGPTPILRAVPAISISTPSAAPRGLIGHGVPAPRVVHSPHGPHVIPAAQPIVKKPVVPSHAPVSHALPSHAPTASTHSKTHALPSAGMALPHPALHVPDLNPHDPAHHALAPHHAHDPDAHGHDDAPIHVPAMIQHGPAIPKHAPPVKPAPVKPRILTAVAKPAMPLAAHPKEEHQDKHLAVQASPGPVAEPSERPSGAKSTMTSADAKGGKDAEIGLLANEVWSLLKRRLAFEAQRAGHH